VANRLERSRTDKAAFLLGERSVDVQRDCYCLRLYAHLKASTLRVTLSRLFSISLISNQPHFLQADDPLI